MYDEDWRQFPNHDAFAGVSLALALGTVPPTLASHGLAFGEEGEAFLCEE